MLSNVDGHLSKKIYLLCEHLSDNISGHFSDTISIQLITEPNDHSGSLPLCPSY
jgi:hypothetical protein